MENIDFWPDEFPAITFCLKDLNKPEWKQLRSFDDVLNEPTVFNENQIRSPIPEATSSGVEIVRIPDDGNKIEVKDTSLDIEDFERETKSLLTNEDEFPFKCGDCVASFKRKRCLVRHKKRVHEAKKPTFNCANCNEKFKFESTLASHKYKQHKIKHYQCDKCSRRISTKRNLLKHNKSGRCRIQTFPCPNCVARYTYKRGLVRHMKKKHAGDRDDCLDEPTAKVARIVTPNANDVVLKMEEMSLGNVQIDTEMLPTEESNTSG